MPFNLEVRRKILHVACGLLFIIGLRYSQLNIIHISILLLVGLILSLLSIKYRLPVLGWFLDMFDRPDEKLPGKGSITYVFGIFLLLLIFNKDNIVYASIIILALGDSVSSIVGRRLSDSIHLKKTRHPFSNKKFLEGTIAGIIIASLGAMLFVSILEAVFASIVAMSIEAIEIKIQKHPIDDNILIPVSAALTIYLIQLMI